MECHVIKISDWYTDFADITFPTVFIRLSDSEKSDLIDDNRGAGKQSLWPRLTTAIGSFHGGVVINADCCAPTDSLAFRRRRILHTPISSWKQLVSSEKVITALKTGITDKLCIRPYRRMDSAREFRLFIKGGQLLAASQYDLRKNYPKLHKKQDELWNSLKDFYNESVKPFSKYDDVVIDVYMCGDGHILVVDFNEWGGDTAPLLLRNWNQNMDEFLQNRHPLLLLAAPVKMGGDVSVSF